MMAHTPTHEITSRWLGASSALPGDEALTKFIADAEDTILAAVPDIEDRLADGRVPMARYYKIVARMVIRHIRNPEGFRQVQETTGPFQRGWTHSGDEPGAIYLTARDRRELLGIRAGRAYQVATMPDGRRRAYDAEEV